MHPMLPEFPSARLVEALDVSSLPTGAISRLLIEVAHDPLGGALRLPVLVARGRRPGPVFGMTAALHGDELNGLPVIHRLFRRLDVSKLKGTLVAVAVVNLPGFFARTRFLAGVDPNHQFPGDQAGSLPRVYAHRLVDRVVRHLEYLVDMHTASVGRVNSLYIRADLGTPMAERMARLQRPQIILDDPPSDKTLRGCADELGIPAITVEIGNPQRFQPVFVKRAVAGMRAVLSDVGMLPKRSIGELPDPIVCHRSNWLYTDHGGLLEVFPKVVDRVEEGQPIARLTNVFGDVIREYRAPWSGVIIGKSVDPVAETGARLVHLGEIVEDPGARGPTSGPLTAPVPVEEKS